MAFSQELDLGRGETESIRSSASKRSPTAPFSFGGTGILPVYCV